MKTLKQWKRGRNIATVSPETHDLNFVRRLGRKLGKASLDQLLKWMPRRTRELNHLTNNCHLWLADMQRDGFPVTFKDYPNLKDMVRARIHLELLGLEYRRRVESTTVDAILRRREQILTGGEIRATAELLKGDSGE